MLEPKTLLHLVRSQVHVLNPERAGLFSLEANSTLDRVVFRSAPGPSARSAGTRSPAQAGRFYPGDPNELNQVVAELLACAERRPEAWPLAMVPHAGLRFSGRVAASVFQRLEIPELVIVIGPKHTPHGVDWAVDPHDAWSIPGATIRSDPDVARAFADSIPGLQLDAAAHRLEHAIEVELPFLARLAPQTRVVGLAIGGGNWELCRQFAAGLARVVRELPSRPLILISSDMNHFATDAENRRLDEVALRALEQLDPQHLLGTVTEHDISMCGALPATIAMETLRLLGGLTACERVSYATSADVTGDPSRVVGYAGVLIR
jgi:AmmeMemoRadiSam system protein B